MASLFEIVQSAGRRGHGARWFFLLLAFCLFVAGGRDAARADDDQQRGRQERDRIVFDIPAQPLASALEVYCAAAGLQMFVDMDAIAGQRAAAIQGTFTRAGALQSLLAGTGLAASFIGDQGFTLVRLPVSATAAGAPNATSVTRLGYSAALQAGLREALCRREETRPGTYRSVGRLWVGGSGSVIRAELVTSTGDRARDEILLAALRSVAVGEPPPPDLPQPITLLLATDAAAAACAGLGRRVNTAGEAVR
ncbi:MAG: hypothetical protein V7608_4781 [Hyphomicrobiales bacterium]|jgi:hypothetical protein